MFLAILLGLCCVPLFFLNLCLLAMFFLGLYTSTWKKTLANVVGICSVKKWYRNRNVYTPQVDYEYLVEGVRYVGNITSFNIEPYYRSSALAEKNASKKYPIGTFIYVFVNPRNPSSSVINAGVSISGFVALVVGVVCMAICIRMLINSLH
jgi:hypothetical protein